MPSTESRYFPVVNIIIGTVASVLLAELVATNLVGWWPHLVFFLATLGAFSLLRDVWGTFQRWRLNRSCKKAYDKVARIFNPKILNPDHPGNLDAMKEEAQQAVDDAKVIMERLGMCHPGDINVNDDTSVEKWYEHLRSLRRQVY